MSLRIFESNKWFHKRFHKTSMVKMGGEYYLHCDTCKRYVPPMPVGICCTCRKPMVLGLFMVTCAKCMGKKFRETLK